MTQFPYVRERPVAWGPPPSAELVPVRLGPGEWLLTVPQGPAGAGEQLESLAFGLARQLPAAAGLAPGGVERLPGEAIDPRLGLAVLHLCGHRRVVYCSAGEVTECGARVLSELAAAIGLPAPGWGGPLRVELQLVGHSALVDEGLHPAVAFGKAAGGVTLVRARVCASLLTAPAAETIGRLWTQQPGCFAAARSPAGAGGVKIPRSGGTARARLRAGVRQVRS